MEEEIVPEIKIVNSSKKENTITLRIDPELLAKITAYESKNNLNGRSSAIRELIKKGLDGTTQ